MKMGWLSLAALAVFASSAFAAADEIPVKGPDGKTVAVIVLCNDCQAGPGKKGCEPGAEDGFRKGKKCGTCLLQSNHVRLLEYGFDLHVTGTLTDTDGRPLQDRFVKLFMPNGWGHRSKTFDKGMFRLILGATAERKGKEPVVVDIGTQVDSKKGDSDAYFAMFMLPPNYKACDATADDAPKEEKPAAKKKSK